MVVVAAARHRRRSQTCPAEDRGLSLIFEQMMSEVGFGKTVLTQELQVHAGAFDVKPGINTFSILAHQSFNSFKLSAPICSR